jgi:acetyl esterase/lipase
MRSILLLIPLTILVPSSLLAQSREYPPTFDGAREVTYKTVDDVELKLWIFEPTSHRAGDKRPAIVFFFGGGWKSGNPGQFEQHCRYLASRGMVAMTADYRVRQRHGTLADKCVADAKSAIRWVRANAERLGVDPDRIVAGGGSAGGHLAACTSVIPDLDDPAESSLQISSVPNALALFNPAVLLAPFDGVTLDEEKLADLVTRTGVEPERISPIHHLRSGLPPTIIFHGQADPTVPYATVEAYAKVATATGNRCELVGYPGATHGFFNYGRDGSPGEFFPATLYRLDRFLGSLGYLEGPPTIARPFFDNVHLRSHFSNSLVAFEQRKRGTVAFIGGSITKMNGYRVMVEQALRRHFPETEFQFINAGISSTCSTTGAFRLTRDVLSFDPDLLFVEFAVNDDQDAAHAARECRRGMEGILRQAREHNRRTDIVVTHFVNPPMLELLQSGGTPTSSGEHEAVAKLYGVSTIDLAREVAERISASELTWKEYGGTHPAEAGNRIATNMIQDLLTAWATPLSDESQPPQHRLPKPIDPNSYSNGRLVDIQTSQTDDRWKIERPDWSELKGSVRERFKEDRLLCATDVGAELTLRFRGTAVGIYLLAGPDAGTLEYSIDEGPTRSVDTYHRFSKGLHYPRTVMFDTDLDGGEHTLTLRIAKDRHPDSSGHAARILNFVAN